MMMMMVMMMMMMMMMIVVMMMMIVLMMMVMITWIDIEASGGLHAALRSSMLKSMRLQYLSMTYFT